jgi:hypothetical protein
LGFEIKDEGQGFLDPGDILQSDHPDFFQKSPMADGPNLEAIDDRFFLQTIPGRWFQQDKKGIISPGRIPGGNGNDDGQSEMLFMPAV